MEKIKNIKVNVSIKILFLFLLGMIFIAIPNKVNAAKFLSISAPKQVGPGETFTATISANNGAGKVNVSVSNGSGSLTEWLENSSVNLTCKAGNSGNVVVSASGLISSLSNPEDEINDSTSVSVPIKSTSSNENVNNNKNNNTVTSSAVLKSLTVDGQNIKIKDSMSITVDNNKTSVNIVAKGDKTCSVVCKGIKNNLVNLDVGTNKVSITVNNNGAIKTYKLNIIRLAEETNVANIDDSTLADENTMAQTDNEEVNDLKLTSLVVKDFDLDPQFDPNVYTYTINIDMDKNDVSTLDIQALSEDGVEVKIIGNELIEGENVITIELKKDDKQAIYQIIVNKIKSSSEIEGMAQKAKNTILGLSNPVKIGVGAGVAVLISGITTAIIVGRRKTKEKDIMTEIDNEDEIFNNILKKERDEDKKELLNKVIEDPIKYNDIDNNNYNNYNKLDKEEQDFEEYKNLCSTCNTEVNEKVEEYNINTKKTDNGILKKKKKKGKHFM